MDSPCIKQTVCKVLKIFQYGKYLVAYVLKPKFTFRHLKEEVQEFQEVCIGACSAPLVADLFCFFYDRDFMSLSENNQAGVIEAFDSTSRYLDDLLNIDNPYFKQMVSQIYPTEHKLHTAHSFDTEKESKHDQEMP